MFTTTNEPAEVARTQWPVCTKCSRLILQHWSTPIQSTVQILPQNSLT